MTEIILAFCGTLAAYFLCKELYRRTRSLWFMPIIICPIVIIAFLLGLGIPYESYRTGGSLVQWLLSPVTVAFAVPLYRQRRLVRRYLPELGVVGVIAALVAIVTTMGLVRLTGADPLYILSLAPRSITMPLALRVTGVLQGNLVLTAIFVIITGVMGTLITVFLTRALNIRNPVLKGLMFGFAAHGTGTAKAYEEGEQTGVMASMAMIFIGIITALLSPLIVPALLWLLQQI